MKNLSLFQLKGMSRTVIDSYMIDNNYKIYNVDIGDTVKDSIVTYKLQSVVNNTIKCYFHDNSIYRIDF